MSFKSDVAELVKLFSDAVLSTAVEGVGVKLAKGSEHWLHHVNTSCLREFGYVGMSRRNSGGGLVPGVVKGSLALGQVIVGDERACSCLTDVPSLWSVAGFGTALYPLAQSVRAAEYLASVERHLKGKRAVASTLLNDRNNLKFRLQGISEFDAKTLSLAEVEVIGALEAKMNEVLAKVKECLGDDKAREQTLIKVQRALVGKVGAEGYEFDTSPVLIGIKGNAMYGGNMLVRQVIAQFTCRDFPDAVLLVPHYVEQYLVSIAGFRQRYCSPGVMVREEDSPKIIETAAGIWDPVASGGLASMTTALEMARTL